MKHAPPSVAQGEPAVRLRDVCVRFTNERATVTALDRINVDVPRGGFLTLLGPSGCGKSTLLRVVADLVAATSGRCQGVGASPSAARERREIGFVFQDASLLPWRTAVENVRLPLEVGGRRQIEGGRDPGELLALVGLAGWERAYPHELSGGMRQRVAIARALRWAQAAVDGRAIRGARRDYPRSTERGIVAHLGKYGRDHLVRDPFRYTRPPFSVRACC